MIHGVMIDLETFDLEPSAVVVEIGACVFPMDGRIPVFLATDPFTCFSRQVSPYYQKDHRRTESEDTLAFHRDNGSLAKYQIHPTVDFSVEAVLDDFSDWVKQAVATYQVDHWWANPSWFDFPILRSLYKDYKKPFPPEMNRRKLMCVKTHLEGYRRKSGFQVEIPTLAGAEKHTALGDAMSQAHFISSTYWIYNP